MMASEHIEQILKKLEAINHELKEVLEEVETQETLEVD